MALDQKAAPAARPPRDNLYRALGHAGLALRSAEAGAMPAMEVRLVVFNEWVEINSVWEGHFLERFAPGSCAKTIREGRDRMRVLFNHGTDPSIGKKVLGPIETIEEFDEYCEAIVPLRDTNYNRELLPGIEGGDYGASVQFGILQERFDQRPGRSAHNPAGLPERTVQEARIVEFGPVTFAAYPSTSSGLRSVSDEVFAARMAAEPERFEDTARRVGIAVPKSVGSVTSTAGGAGSQVVVEVAGDSSALERSISRERRYERSIEAAGAAVWPIHPAALQTIMSVIAERARGEKPSADELRERLGLRQEDVPEGAPADVVEEAEAAADTSLEPKVRVLALAGPIFPRANLMTEVSGATSLQSFLGEFRAAVADPAVKAILLDVDSPGGMVDLVPEAAAEIMAARGQKRIVAVANTFAASAAYWLGSAAGEFVASPSAEVGSIGVYTMHEDWSKHDEALGVKTTLVSAGKYKTEGNPFEPLSSDAEEEMQRKVDAIYKMFVAAVAKGRGTTAAKVRDDFGKGRTVMASEALDAGMVDRVATFNEVLSELEAMPAASEGERQDEPEPSEATTRGEEEPEPSEATTPEQPRKFNTRKDWLTWTDRI